MISLLQGPRWMRTSYVPDLTESGEVLGLYTVTIESCTNSPSRKRGSSAASSATR